MRADRIPDQFELMWPTLEALKARGGSATIGEIVEQVVEDLAISEDLQTLKRRPGDSMSQIEYLLAWSRNGLKQIGVIENSARGVWSLTDAAHSFRNSHELVAAVRRWRSEYNREYHRRRRESVDDQAPLEAHVAVEPSDRELDEVADPPWQDQLLTRLTAMSPDAFERLAQRLLREAGFRDVTVLGKSGDGGIDGVGVLRVSLVSFPIYFQCKRYRDSVGAGAVRDFRGAMSGRGEKGLLISTGTFTREARKEATRDGAPPVELIGGQDLCELLLQYELGLFTKVHQIKEVQLQPEFFDQFE